jgi:hypothetical protein
MHRYFFTVLLYTLYTFCHAQPYQKTLQNKKQNIINQFLYSTTKDPQHTLGIIAKANTDGWAAGLFYQKKVTTKTQKYYCLEITERKNNKEEKIKTTLPIYQDFGKQIPYIYGKINSLYTLNAQYGRTKLLLPNFITPSISIAWQYYGGASLSMLKPYSLQVKTTDQNQLAIATNVIYNTNNTDTFLNKNNIYSRSNFGSYWQQSKWLPSVNMGCGLKVDVNASKAFSTSICVGVNGNVYYSQLQLMANGNKQWVFMNGYFSVMVGRMY